MLHVGTQQHGAMGCRGQLTTGLQALLLKEA